VAGVISKYKTGTLTRMDISKVSLNNQYQVNISGITADLEFYLRNFYRLPEQYSTGKDIGIMCSDATLPTSSFATAEVKDNYQGINQQFAHSRLYIDSDFTFYVDQNYNTLKFFEGWMDYVAGDDNLKSIDRRDNYNYYRRFNYPMGRDGKVGYKSDNLMITKFERSVGISTVTASEEITYNFINAFPKGMTSMPVQYGNADLLKVNVQFAYDRYIVV
tara:strand:- start:43 stop:696 length:654 start_codon:yes stop_codon:yes gene_type:complete